MLVINILTSLLHFTWSKWPYSTMGNNKLLQVIKLFTCKHLFLKMTDSQPYISVLFHDSTGWFWFCIVWHFCWCFFFFFFSYYRTNTRKLEIRQSVLQRVMQGYISKETMRTFFERLLIKGMISLIYLRQGISGSRGKCSISNPSTENWFAPWVLQ